MYANEEMARIGAADHEDKKLLPTQKSGNNQSIIKCRSNPIDGRGKFRYNILNCVTEFPHEKGRAYEQQRYRKDPERASEIHAGA